MSEPPLAASTDFGLLAWLEATRLSLPLKGVECRFQVTGDIVSVELDQIYHQSAAQPLDCTYAFPLPSGAAVYRCEMIVGERVLRARVQEREAARLQYQAQRAAGRRAALVEVERENLFTLSLGNLQPEDVIVVRLAWFQVLERMGAERRLLVPTCPGVRYLPGRPLLRANRGRGTADDTDQVPDASRISPPRIDALHPDAAYFSLAGRLELPEVETGTASSPTHPIYVRERGSGVEVELSGQGFVPDRDFVLAWREPVARQLQPAGWSWHEGEETYALVQLRAPNDVPVAPQAPQDFYFLVDRSGSMAGRKWVATCEALHAFVRLLAPEDRVFVTLFESSYQDFSEAPMGSRQMLSERNFLNLAAMGTGGGTDLLPAAEHVLKIMAAQKEGRRTSVILITDGQVGNEAEIDRLFARAPGLIVHTFGIDDAVNDSFLKKLARQQCGHCSLQTPNDDIAAAVAALGDRLRRPVLTALKPSGGWESALERWPNLHAQELVSVVVRGHGFGPVEIAGRTALGEERRMLVPIEHRGNEGIKLVWVRDRQAALLQAGRTEEAITLAVRHNVLCEGAAFVAWDEAEKVAVARHEVVQPNLVQPCLAAASPQYRCEELRAPGRSLVQETLDVLQDWPALESILRHDEPTGWAADDVPDRNLTNPGPMPEGNALKSGSRHSWLRRRFGFAWLRKLWTALLRLLKSS